MEDKSILEMQISPYKQAGIVLVMAVVFMTFSGFIPSSPYSTTGPIMPWVVMCGLILFYAIINSILSLSAINGTTYWMQSIFGFMILLVGGGLLAWAFSGVTIGNAGSVTWIYFVFTFGYLVFLSIVNLIKFFVKMAQRQDSRLRGEDD